MRRDAIVEVARRSFFERGYAGTTMSGIASELGGSKGTLWSYFASKELLFAAVVDNAGEAFRERQIDILVPESDVPEALGRFAVEFLRRIVAPDAIALCQLVVSEAPRFPELGEIVQERLVGITRHMLGAYIAEAMARGRLRGADSWIAAQHLVGMCMAGCHQRLLFGQPEGITEAAIADEAAAAVGAFLRAYAPDPIA